jgi:CheY-like chemotaxis protein
MEPDEMRFTLEKGINSQYLAMEGLRRLDEKHQQEVAKKGETIPIKAPPADRGGGPIPHAPAEPLPLSPGHPPEPEKRHVIVLVEDHGETRETLAGSLEECGYEVYPFSGGADSPLMRLASLHREGVRPVLLIDLIMPKMDGTGTMGGSELIDLIGSNFPDIPVLAMADLEHYESEEELRILGHPLIIKPGEEDIGNPGLLNDFMADLLSGLNRVRSGEGTGSAGGNVNLGDQLRRELGEEPAPTPPPVVQSTGIALLRGMLEELNDPALEGGIILLVLRFAAEFMNRGVIFMVRGERIEGLGQFGIDIEGRSADSVVRGMKIPSDDDSLFARVLKERASFKVAPDDGKWTRYLLENLGGEAPAEMFMGPIVSEGKVVAMLYGDNLPVQKPIGDTDSLEIFLSQAGVAMEKAILQSKLKGLGVEGK